MLKPCVLSEKGDSENNVIVTPEQLEILNLLLEQDARSMQEISIHTNKDNSVHIPNQMRVLR